MKLDFHGHENNWSSKEPNQYPRNSLTIGSKFTVGCPPPIQCVAHSIYFAIPESIKYLKIGL